MVPVTKDCRCTLWGPAGACWCAAQHVKLMLLSSAVWQHDSQQHVHRGAGERGFYTLLHSMLAPVLVATAVITDPCCILPEVRKEPCLRLRGTVCSHAHSILWVRALTTVSLRLCGGGGGGGTSIAVSRRHCTQLVAHIALGLS